MVWFRDTRTIDQLVQDVGATTPREAAPRYLRRAVLSALSATIMVAAMALTVMFNPKYPYTLLFGGFPAGFYAVAYNAYCRYGRLASS